MLKRNKNLLLQLTKVLPYVSYNIFQKWCEKTEIKLTNW